MISGWESTILALSRIPAETSSAGSSMSCTRASTAAPYWSSASVTAASNRSAFDSKWL